MKHQTNTLTGADLNRAVAMCLGHEVEKVRVNDALLPGVSSLRWTMLVEGRPTTIPDYAGDIALAWPIINREGISIIRCDDDYGTDEQGFCNNVRIPVWAAARGQQSYATSTEDQSHEAMYQLYMSEVVHGHDAITAAMRCFVASVHGNTIELEE